MKTSDELVHEHLNLVHHVARQMERKLTKGIEHDELVSAGTLGLIAASQCFDPNRGLAFSTYAVPRIRGAILDELRKNDHVPRSVRRKIREMGVANAAVQNTFNRQATAQEVADVLEVPLSKVFNWQADVEGAVRMSIDRPPSEKEDGFPLRVGLSLLDKSERPDARVEWEDQVAVLKKAILGLKPRERTVISLYYFEELTLNEIAELIQLTESRVSQIRRNALKHLRERLANEHP